MWSGEEEDMGVSVQGARGNQSVVCHIVIQYSRAPNCTSDHSAPQPSVSCADLRVQPSLVLSRAVSVAGGGVAAPVAAPRTR